MLTEQRGERPLLLLDDVTGEFDAERRELLLDALTRFDQAVVTTTDAADLGCRAPLRSCVWPGGRWPRERFPAHPHRLRHGPARARARPGARWRAGAVAGGRGRDGRPQRLAGADDGREPRRRLLELVVGVGADDAGTGDRRAAPRGARADARPALRGRRGAGARRARPEPRPAPDPAAAEHARRLAAEVGSAELRPASSAPSAARFAADLCTPSGPFRRPDPTPASGTLQIAHFPPIHAGFV